MVHGENTTVIRYRLLNPGDSLVVLAVRVPQRVPLNSISVVSIGLSTLCDQQLADSTKATKVRSPPSPPALIQPK
jgi:hypothetical protein